MRTLLTALLFALTATGLAQNIAYTVQVVAVSDQAQAFSLIRDLGLDNYPAYATRATTAQGDIVRVRVGGFANRAAALLYAESMPEMPVPDSQPLPALADNIPPGVMPFEPALLLDTAEQDFRLLEWGNGLAVEFPAGEDGQKHYLLFNGEAGVEFNAYRAWREADGLVVRQRELPLWPADWRGHTGEQLEAARNEVLDGLAARLGVEAAELERAVRQRQGMPVVVLLERFNPWQNLEFGQLLGVTLPEDGSSWDGPVLGEEVTPQEPVVLVEDPVQLEVRDLTAEDWTISLDEPFMLQAAAGRSWRAAVGAPLWTDGTHVLASHQGRFLVYSFTARP